MRAKRQSDDVSDLKLAGPSSAVQPLLCGHAFRQIRPGPTARLDSSPAVSTLCRPLRWRLQSPQLLVLGSISLSGFRPTDLSRKLARHRSLSAFAPPATVSLGTARRDRAQHAGRSQRKSRLAHLRRPRPRFDPAGATTLRDRRLGRRTGANGLRAGRHHHRFVFEFVSVGALPPHQGRGAKCTRSWTCAAVFPPRSA